MPKKKENVINFPSAPSKLERQIEAILFAASEPLDIETIEKRLQTNSNIKKNLEKIRKTYKNRGINLICIKNKWSFRTAEDLSKLMSFQKSTQKKLSKSTIETLAIIVYHQPVTRSEIEEIRGISSSKGSLDILLDYNWIEIAGKKDIPGRPILYRTTKKFLLDFNLSDINELPNLSELKREGLLSSLERK